jgi:hypothetical protein
MERAPKKREEYMQTLLNEGYVKVSENYRAAVEPLLKLTRPTSAKKEEEKKEKP